MSIKVKPDGRISEETPREFVLTQTNTSGVTTAIDLGANAVQMKYLKPGSTTWVELISTDPQLEITTAASGLITLKPADSFWNTVGLWRFYFQVQSTVKINCPNSEMLEIIITDGTA